MVMAWLVQSMKPSVGKMYIFLPSAKGVCDAIHKTNSDAENFSQIFEIKVQLWHMKQGSMEVTKYYMEMVGIWQELDLIYEQ